MICQHTPVYSINVESNTCRELEKGSGIRVYYLHMHDCGIRSLSTVKYRIQKCRLCSRERTTNADSICVMVNMAKKIASRLTNIGLRIQNLCSTIDPIIRIRHLTKSCIEVSPGDYERIRNTLGRIQKRRN